jgi:hypothetical protein
LAIKKTLLILQYQNKTTMENLEIVSKVREYKGDNSFIISLQGGLKKYGSLTANQLSAANKFFSKINEPKLELPKQKEVNVNIKVTKFIAKRIAEQNKLEFRPFLLTVSKIISSTSKAYQFVGKMNTSDVSSCRCCGLDLTDWRSQATGVGPVCSRKLGIPYVKNVEDVEVYKKLLKLKVDSIGDITFWVPISQIVEGLSELSLSLQ